MKIKNDFNDLKPVIWKSKVGNITFVFPFFKQRIKIFQAANADHAVFLKSTLNHPDLSGYFHPILWTLGRYVFSGWVKGISCETLSNEQKYLVIDWIVTVQTRFHQIALCKHDEEAGLNYLDYLEKRLIRFAPPETDLEKIQKLRVIASSSPVTISSLSHPDMTLRNIVLEESSGNYKIIDNELLTQSPFFLLDIYNTCYSLGPNPELIHHYLDRYSSCQKGFDLQPGWASSLAAAWSLRLAGSHFQAGRYQKGAEVLEHWDAGNQEIVEMIVNTQTHPNQAYISSKIIK